MLSTFLGDIKATGRMYMGNGKRPEEGEEGQHSYLRGRRQTAGITGKDGGAAES